MWPRCPKKGCGCIGAIKDDGCNHVFCVNKKCGLKFCYACGRSNEQGVQPLCKHVGVTKLTEILEKEIAITQPLDADNRVTHWEHTFFLARAHAVVSLFFESLTATQRILLRQQPCPIRQWLADNVDLAIKLPVLHGQPRDRRFILGKGADKFLKLEQNGWCAFLDAGNEAHDLLHRMVATHFPEWREDIKM
jgi:hypothetical protein